MEIVEKMKMKLSSRRKEKIKVFYAKEELIYF